MTYPSRSVVSGSLPTRPVDRTVDDMLLDAGMPDAAELRAALVSLGSLAALPAPEPRAELAALLSGTARRLPRLRLLRKHRTSVVGLAVVAGMGLGVTGVAATASGPDLNASRSVQQLLADWTPAWTVTGSPFAALEDAKAQGGPAGRAAFDSGNQPASDRPGTAQYGDFAGGNGADAGTPQTPDGGTAGDAAGGIPNGAGAPGAAPRDGGAAAGQSGPGAASGREQRDKSAAGAAAGPVNAGAGSRTQAEKKFSR